MSRKHFSWLLFVTFLVGAFVLILPEPTGQDEVSESGLLLPGMADQVNELDWLRLTAAGNQTAKGRSLDRRRSVQLPRRLGNPAQIAVGAVTGPDRRS